MVKKLRPGGFYLLDRHTHPSMCPNMCVFQPFQKQKERKSRSVRSEVFSALVSIIRQNQYAELWSTKSLK